MREYVEKALHTRVDCEPVDASGLPLYLRGLYSLERWTAFGVPFAVAFPVESPTVKTMAKHRDALEAALGTPVSFALEGATGYRVGRMLEAGLPFIALDKQVYQPFLGIALSSGRSHARDRRQTDVGTFSPQAHRLRIELSLYGHIRSKLTGLLQQDIFGAVMEGRFRAGFRRVASMGTTVSLEVPTWPISTLTTARPLPMASRSTATMTS